MPMTETYTYTDLNVGDVCIKIQSSCVAIFFKSENTNKHIRASRIGVHFISDI